MSVTRRPSPVPSQQALYFELTYPTPPERDALDARPFYEKRLAEVLDLRIRCFNMRRIWGWPVLVLSPEVRAAMTDPSKVLLGSALVGTSAGAMIQSRKQAMYLEIAGSGSVSGGGLSL